MTRRRRLLAGSLASAATLTLPGCAWLDLRQRQAVYRPDRRVAAGFAGLGGTDRAFSIDVPGDHGQAQPVALWWLPAEGSAPALLYLHGTFRNLTHNHPKMLALGRAGFSVLAVDYRGWGDSASIVPSEQSIYADAWAAWQVLETLEPSAKRRVLFGHSMGSGVAVELASLLSPRHAIAGVILESAFTCLPDVARASHPLAHPLSWLATQAFDSERKIAAVRSPLLMMHGAADRTVSIDLGRRLFAAAGEPKRFVTFEAGGHSGLHDDDPALYQRSIREWRERTLG